MIGGLILRDRNTDGVEGLEVWRASERLPTEFLETLPQPEAGEIVIERQSVSPPSWTAFAGFEQSLLLRISG
jgi:hypothetical protein